MAEKTTFRHLIELSTIGLNMTLCTFVGFGMGYGLDYLMGKYLFDTFPWLSLIFLIFGIIAGYRELYRLAKKQDRGNKKDI